MCQQQRRPVESCQHVPLLPDPLCHVIENGVVRENDIGRRVLHLDRGWEGIANQQADLLQIGLGIQVRRASLLDRDGQIRKPLLDGRKRIGVPILLSKLCPHTLRHIGCLNNGRNAVVTKIRSRKPQAVRS